MWRMQHIESTTSKLNVDLTVPRSLADLKIAATQNDVSTSIALLSDLLGAQIYATSSQVFRADRYPQFPMRISLYNGKTSQQKTLGR